MFAIALGLGGATTIDVMVASGAGPKTIDAPVAQGGSDSAPPPGLLDGGILRDGSLPDDGPSAPLDTRATPARSPLREGL